MNNLFKSVERFVILAQQDPHDTKFRHLVINQPPIPNSLSFYDMANAVLADIKSLDPNEQDAGLKQSHYSLLDILKETFQTPNPNQMLSAANEAYNIISNHPNTDQAKINNAKYLLALTRLIIAKYFTPKSAPNKENNAEEQQKQPTAENPITFLQRLYKQLRKGNQLSDQDKEMLNKYRSSFQRRLNGLNSLPSRTSPQEQEKQVLDTVLKSAVFNLASRFEKFAALNEHLFLPNVKDYADKFIAHQVALYLKSKQREREALVYSVDVGVDNANQVVFQGLLNNKPSAFLTNLASKLLADPTFQKLATQKPLQPMAFSPWI